MGDLDPTAAPAERADGATAPNRIDLPGGWYFEAVGSSTSLMLWRGPDKYMGHWWYPDDARAFAQALAGPAAGAGAVPVAYMVDCGETGDGWGVRMWTARRRAEAEGCAKVFGAEVVPLYAAVPPQAAPAAAEPGLGERRIAPPGGAADLAEVPDGAKIADAMERCDWSVPSIGNNAILRAAVARMWLDDRALRRRSAPIGDAAGLIEAYGVAVARYCEESDGRLAKRREAEERARAALSGHIAAQAARIAEQDAAARLDELRDLVAADNVRVLQQIAKVLGLPDFTEVTADAVAALRTSAGAGVAVSAELLDAARYRWLRTRDVEQIHLGGVFAGKTPDNVVLTEEDLDQAVDTAMQRENAR